MSLDVTTLALAKSYADQHGGSGGGENTIYIPAKLNTSGETFTIETSVTFEQINAAYKSGQEQILKLFVDDSGEGAYLLPLVLGMPDNIYYFGMIFDSSIFLAGATLDGWSFSTSSLIDRTMEAILPKLKPSQVEGVGVTSVTLADNTEYRYRRVTNLTIKYPYKNFECWMHLAFADEGTITVTLPVDTKYIGPVPDFKNGERWELSIKDGIVIAGKVAIYG